jgi:hypothetical protein
MPELVPDPHGGASKRPIFKVRRGAVPSVDRKAAIKRMVDEVYLGVEQGAELSMDLVQAEAIIRTRLVTLKDGRFLLPDDVDTEQTEEVEIRMRFVPAATE